MDDRLHGLSKIPGREEQGLYLQELREQCALLEAQLWQEAENGSQEFTESQSMDF